MLIADGREKGKKGGAECRNRPKRSLRQIK